jgi:hypothetical protein
MEGFDVITSDGEKVGRVVGTDGGNLVVEHGWVRKSRHAVPQAIAHTDSDEHVVRLDVSKQVFEDGPTADGDGIDEKAVAAYYGLAAGEDAPATQGYGDVVPDDPARSAEHDARRAGVETAEQQRVRVRESMRPEAEEGPPKGARGIHQDYRGSKE